VCAITFLVAYLVLVIRDLDDPFDYARPAGAPRPRSHCSRSIGSSAGWSRSCRRLREVPAVGPTGGEVVKP
jgi:hypothetical protein